MLIPHGTVLEKRLRPLYADVEGPMLTPAGGTQHCLMMIDGAINLGWPAFLMDESAATVTLGFRSFLAAINPYGKPVLLGTGNGLVLTKNEFRKLIADNAICREFTSVAGPKSKEGGTEAGSCCRRGDGSVPGLHLMLDGTKLLAKALDYGRTRPNA